jgi:hypothetical protein
MRGLRFVWSILLLSAALWLAPSQAQSDPPPRHQSRTDTGVNVNDGSFSFEEQDLSIGGEGTAGLTLTRSYNSSVDSSGPPFVGAGWTHSFSIYITMSTLPQSPDFPPPQTGWPLQDVVDCVYNIAGGPKSVGFYLANGGWTTGCGPFNTTYAPMNPSGSSLEMVLEAGHYHYRFTGADGTVINFSWGGYRPEATDLTYPDGTRLDFANGSGVSRLVSSNRGWAMLFENATKVCAVNTALTYVTAESVCPANAQTVTYTTVASGYTGITSRTKGSETRQYQYASDGHVNCIIDPGQTGCRIQNTYYNCPLDPSHPANTFNIRLHDLVTSQTDGSGRTYTYNYSQDKCPLMPNDTNPDYRPFTDTTATMTESGVTGNSVALTSPGGNLRSFTDPLGHLSQYVHQSAMPPSGYSGNVVETGDLVAEFQHEGTGYFISDSDDRGNPKITTIYAKPGSGLANVATTSVYPTTCSNRKTCNKPSSTTDAKGNQTDYTYDTNSGNVLTETAPAGADGIRPVKRFAYVQRAAWLKNSGGTYTASAYPVWVLSEMRSCRTSATVSNACAAGSTDEVVTTYDYGPDSGPNNLLVRGVAVTADSQTLRTCVTYDQDGHKLSETKPLGTGATCP